MNKYLKVLGNGQVWDVKGITTLEPKKTFEDLFSGRGLGQMAQKRSIFSAFKEKGKITGLSVTKALLSNNKQAKGAAKALLENLARNGAGGITALNRGKAIKAGWTNREKGYWKNLDFVIIGGGVSEELTGRVLVGLINKYLSKDGLSNIKVSQAKFPGKEAGFLGAVINIIKEVCNEGKARKLKVIHAIGLDLGREEIGVGLLAINPSSGKILKQKKHYWIFKYAVKTPYRKYLKNFMDSRRNYTQAERKLGERIRSAILGQMSDLILKAQNKTLKTGLACAHNLGVAVPGSASTDGFIVNSTDYLPFFRKQDNFNFARELEKSLVKDGIKDFHVHIVNDGVAAGIANIYFDLPKAKRGKFAFLGVGSGLGGCVGVIKTL